MEQPLSTASYWHSVGTGNTGYASPTPAVSLQAPSSAAHGSVSHGTLHVRPGPMQQQRASAQSASPQQSLKALSPSGRAPAPAALSPSASSQGAGPQRQHKHWPSPPSSGRRGSASTLSPGSPISKGRSSRPPSHRAAGDTVVLESGPEASSGGNGALQQQVEACSVHSGA